MQALTEHRHIEHPFAWQRVGLVACSLFIVHLLCAGRYGYFRDELYYLACAKHLDWGYVDQPPLSIGVLWVTTKLLGESLWAIRLPVFLSGAVTLWAIAETTRRLGGNAFSQTLAALVFAIAPVYLVVGHLFAMNGLDVLFWSTSILAWICALQHPASWRWILLGLLVGLGLLNKLSILWLIAGVATAMIATEHRRALRTPGPWLTLAVAGLLSTPHVLWQVQHGWPTVEFVRNATQYKMIAAPAWIFLLTQVAVMNPITLPVWMAGSVRGLLDARWRPCWVAFICVLAILLVSGKTRPNYLSPAFPLVIAPGAVACGTMLSRSLRRSLFGLAIGGGLLLAPLALPVVPIDHLKGFLETLPVKPPADERGQKCALQGFADMQGWPELTRATNLAFHKLSLSDRKQVVILAGNYGEAAALQHFGKGLPPVISLHNNYWIWGAGGWDGSIALAVNLPRKQRNLFTSVECLGHAEDSLAVPEERQVEISLVRGLKMPVKEFWREYRRLE